MIPGVVPALETAHVEVQYQPAPVTAAHEARELMREHFPELANQGDAYGAFTFGTSGNRYDITLETLVQQTEDYDEETV